MAVRSAATRRMEASPPASDPLLPTPSPPCLAGTNASSSSMKTTAGLAALAAAMIPYQHRALDLRQDPPVKCAKPLLTGTDNHECIPDYARLLCQMHFSQEQEL